MYQHRVLFWGILGAIVMRAVLILVGDALIRQFHWVLYIFFGIFAVHRRQDDSAGQGRSQKSEGQPSV